MSRLSLPTPSNYLLFFLFLLTKKQIRGFLNKHHFYIQFLVFYKLIRVKLLINLIFTSFIIIVSVIINQTTEFILLLLFFRYLSSSFLTFIFKFTCFSFCLSSYFWHLYIYRLYLLNILLPLIQYINPYPQLLITNYNDLKKQTFLQNLLAL